MIASCGRTGAALLAIGLLLIAAEDVRAQGKGGPPGSSGSPDAAVLDDDAQVVVFLHAQNPVFLRLHLQIDERSFQALRRDQLLRVFQSLDEDGNGVLDASESKSIPVPSQLSRPEVTPGPARQLDLREIDRPEPDGAVTFDEFAAYAARFTGKPFAIEAVDSGSGESQRRDLFPKWDADRDGTLDLEELRLAAKNLRKYDGNDDELLSLDEWNVIGSEDGTSFDQAVQSSSPFVRIDSLQPVRPIAERLIARYADPSARVGLDDGVLSFGKTEFARWDADNSGVLDAGELEALLNAAPVHADILIRISRRALPPLAVSLLDKSPHCPVRLSVAASDDSTQSLTIGSTRVKLVPTYSPVPIYSSRRVRSAFQEADEDGNQYLDEGELLRLMLPASAFVLIDQDENGRISEEELLTYVALHHRLGRSLTTMYVTGDALSLFGVIDANSDDRLSLRELADAADRLKLLDADADGRVAVDELLTELSVSFRIGHPYLLGAIGMSSARRNTEYDSDPTMSSPQGPEWFQKMDRNRDGDVSLREFLGPLDVFRKLDANSDGLLDADEAASNP